MVPATGGCSLKRLRSIVQWHRASGCCRLGMGAVVGEAPMWAHPVGSPSDRRRRVSQWMTAHADIANWPRCPTGIGPPHTTARNRRSWGRRPSAPFATQARTLPQLRARSTAPSASVAGNAWTSTIRRDTVTAPNSPATMTQARKDRNQTEGRPRWPRGRLRRSTGDSIDARSWRGTRRACSV